MTDFSTDMVIVDKQGRGTSYLEDIIFQLDKIEIDTPSSASDLGTTGQLKADGSFLYICVSTDTWLRVAIATW